MDSLTLGFLCCNITHYVCRCHLTTCHIAMWELRFEEMAKENDDTLVIAISISNKPSLVFDPGITRFLSAFIGNINNKAEKPSRKEQLSRGEGEGEQRFLQPQWSALGNTPPSRTSFWPLHADKNQKFSNP